MRFSINNALSASEVLETPFSHGPAMPLHARAHHDVLLAAAAAAVDDRH
jgi:hypothetical protein